jgi:hypothetical protein
MADERILLLKERAPGRIFDIYEAREVAYVYTDGYARVFSGPAVTKIELFRTTGLKQEGSQQVEEREVFMRLHIPTITFIEGAGIALSTLDLKLYDESYSQFRDTMVTAEVVPLGETAG